MAAEQYDGLALYAFLSQTPEGGLRKMLVDKQFSPEQFTMLMKIVRGCNETAFNEHFTKGDFPKLKFTPKEIPLKESFWNALITVCNSRGLLSPAQPKVA